MDLGDHSSEVLPRIYSTKFAGANDGEEDSGSFCSSFRMSSVPSLSPDHWVSKLSFLLIVIDGDVRVSEKECELVVIF